MNAGIRNRSVALVGAATLAVAGVSQAGAIAAPVHATAAKPSLSKVSVTPDNPHKGHGFHVSFKSKAGGTYEIFYSTGQSGDLLKSGKTKTGTITTHRMGKKIHAGSITVGVRVTVGKKAKTVTKPVTIRP